MKRKIILLVSLIAVIGALLTGCASSGSREEEQSQETEEISKPESAPEEEASREESPENGKENPAPQAVTLEDGTYTAKFDTDSSMFHVSEACDGKGTLTVENGEMVIHVSLASKNIVNLFSGTAEDARKEGAKLLDPTTDSVTYSDGITEDVYGFDIPVPALDEEFDLALIGTKGTWYDHKVSVSNPQKME